MLRENRLRNGTLRGRGRPRREAAEAFVWDIAATYQAATGNAPTISTNPASSDQGYTGPFAKLLEAVHADAGRIFRQVCPDRAWPLSPSIGRYAKSLRLTSAAVRTINRRQ